MKYDLFELSVAVPSKHGTSKIPEYGHKGLTFVEGRLDQPYTIKLRNDSAQRVMALLSIDGLNVIDGEPCTPASRGYIIPAYTTVDIDGWRTSLAEIRRFKFEGKAASYAKSMTGEVQNCGIISAKFFSEKFDILKVMQAAQAAKEKEEHHHHHHHHYHDEYWPYWPYRPHPHPIWPNPYPVWYTTSLGASGNVGPSGVTGTPSDLSNITVKCASNVASGQYTLSNSAGPMYAAAASNAAPAINMMSATQADVPDFKLGTGWGEAKADYVTETTFERDKELCTLAVYYAESSDLERVGIQLAKDVTVTPAPALVLPQAFSGFCKPPVSR